MSGSESFELAEDEVQQAVREFPLRVSSERRVRSLFGVSTSVMTHVWRMIRLSVDRSLRAQHLLWALYFLKVYPTETAAAAVLHVDEKTFRKYLWPMVYELATMRLVSVVVD